MEIEKFKLYTDNNQMKYGNNFILTGEGRMKWIEDNRPEKCVVLENATKEQQKEVYRANKETEDFVLFLIEPKELSDIWYSFPLITTIIVTDNSDKYWDEYTDLWFTDYTQEEPLVIDKDGKQVDEA